MSDSRSRLASAVFALLLVLGLSSLSISAAAASTGRTAAKTASRQPHRTVPAYRKGSRSMRRALARTAAADALAQRPASALADGQLSSEVEALTPIPPHVKTLKQHQLRADVLGRSSERAAQLSSALDSQFPGLDENNDDSDQLNLGDDFSADTDGAVGPKYYGEVVGTAYGFFDKATGALVDDDTLLDLFSGTGIGEPCDTSDQGANATDAGYYEPHVLYDSQADRWIVMITADPDNSAIGPYDECIAVSASGDPVNGDWYFYSVPLVTAGDLIPFSSTVGVWTDGIYFSETLACDDTACPGYNPNEEFVGTQVWDFNRSDLESGAPLRVQTTQGVGGIGSGNFTGSRTTTTFSNLDADGIVAANLETMTGLPPAGRNEYFVSMSDLPGSAATPLGDGLMDVWQYHVDWVNPGNSWIGQSASSQIDYQVTTPTYGVPDFSTGEITEPSPGNTLDTDYDYILPKPQYTDFGGVESLWTAHATSTCSGSCNSSSTTGPDRIRWNQISLNSSDGSPVTSAPAQGEDYAPAPTTLNRWLPAIGVDQDGDMAVGYSGTSSAALPSLYLAGRLSSDPANTLTSLPETEVYAGTGYQTGSYDLSDVADTIITNFGPENSMSLDPNGCELWFAGQVDVGSPVQPDGSDNAYATEISAFHFPGCTASTLATSLTTSGSADESAGTGTLTATLTANGTGSGVVGEPVSFTLGGTSVGTATTDSNGVATLSGVDTSAYAPGTYGTAVGAAYAGDSTYNYGSSCASGSLLVANTQTISFGSLASQTYGNAPFTVSATASSGLPVSFSASGDNGSGEADSGTCSVSGASVTITGAGICTITATQAGDGANYLPAAPVSQTFDIAQESQTITVTGAWSSTDQTVGSPFTASATASSGGTVYFTSDETNCTENDNGDTPQDSFVPLHTGSCTIYAIQAGTTDISQAILPVTVPITGLGNQTGAFAVTSTSRRVDQLQNTPDDVTWTSGLTDSTYSTSGTVTAASVAASTALTVSGAPASVSITGATESKRGSTVTVTVTVASTSAFTTGESVVIAGIAPTSYDGTFSVTVATSTTLTYTDNSVTANSTSTSGATATSAGSAGATESGNTVTITTTAANTGKITSGDTVSVEGLSVAGYDGNYVVSVTGTTTFTYTDPTSGLAVSGNGTVGDTAITGASESGNTVTLNLAAAPTTAISLNSSITVAGVSPTTYNGTFTVTAVPSSTSLQYTDATAAIAAGGAGSVQAAGSSCIASGTLGSETLTALHAGSCTVTATQAGDADYNPAVATRTYTITAGTQSVTWSPPGGSISASTSTSVSVTTNSGLNPGTVTATTPTICSVGSTTASGGTSSVTVTPLSTGTCTLSVSGNAATLDWSALAAKTQSFTVSTLATQTISFTAPPPATLAESPVTASATASSGLQVSFSSTTTAVCTTGGVNGATVTLATAGTCTIVASQAGDGVTWAAAASVTKSFTVTTANQLLEFAQLPDVTYGVAPFAVTAASVNAYYPAEVSSGTPTGLAVSYSAAGTCTVDGSGNVTATGAGTCTITASQGGSSIYNPAQSIANEFSVLQTSSSISFANPGTQTYGTADFNPGATATSGEPVSYTATGTCSIASGLVEIDGAGGCTVTAHSVGDANNLPPAAVSQTFSILKANQTISFSVGTHTYGDSDFTISATATSGDTVLFSVISGDCTLNGSTVHITGAGNCTIAADQSGDANYNPATEVQDTFSIDQASQSITFPSIAEQSFGNPDVDPGATASSGLAVSYTAGPSGVCSITGSNEVEIDGNGVCTVTASQPGNDNYAPASTVQQSFTIGSGEQSITFSNPGTQSYGEPDFDPGATASSGLAVSYSASGDCTITGSNQVHLSGAGSCTVAADQAGDSNWDPATEVDQTFDINPGDQSITFANPGSQTYGAPDFSPGATASSDLAVSYSASGECSIDGGGLVEIDGAGSCTVTASQSGDTDYNAATDVSQTFSILKADQTISFSVGTHTYGDPDFTISATATSGDTVLFSVISGDCTLNGSTVHITGAGNCTIAADQSGDANYNPATEVQDTFSIDQASQSITFPSIAEQSFGGADFSPGATASSDLAVSYTAGPSGVCSITGSGLVEIDGTGSCTVTAAQAGNANYAPASEEQQAFSIVAANQTITFPNPGTQTYGSSPFLLTASASSGLPVSYSASGPCAALSNGKVVLVGAGTCTITASQAGGTDYNPATSVTESFTINPMATRSTLALTPASQAPGGMVVLKATVKAMPHYHPTGQVSFYVNGALVGSSSLGSGGVARYTYTVSLPHQAAKYPVYAVFASSDSNFAGSTSVTKKLKVTA